MITEATVIAVAAGLYLFDCVVLLERGQALWSRGALSFGSNHYQIRGKAVALLNPLTPFVPTIRTLPLFSVSFGTKISSASRAVAPLAIPSLAQFVLVFAVLPWCLYRAPGWPLLTALALAYLNAIAMLGVSAWRFRKAGLATRPLAALGFACLACLPLSVNTLRKAGLAVDVGVDARRAIRYLSPDARQRARDDLAAQVAESMHELEEDDDRHRRLAELRRTLAPEVRNERV